jgi:hypothetical protein
MNTELARFKLCYICPRTRFAYFTELDLKDQWGDDWNDAPYEHNAGDPYEHRFIDKEPVHHQIVKVAWEGSYETPAERGGPNSLWSVEEINKGAIAWLIPTQWDSSVKDARPVHAGDTLLTFIEKIEGSGGTVYMSRELCDSLRREL